MHKYVLLSAILFAILIVVSFGHSKQVVKDFLDSLRANNQGFSNTKIMGWVGMIAAVYISTHYASPENLKDILFMWLGFIAIALGLVKVGDLIQLRTGQKVTETEKQVGASLEKTKTQEPADPKPRMNKVTVIVCIVSFIIGGIVIWALKPANVKEDKREIEKENVALRKQVQLFDRELKIALSQSKLWMDAYRKLGDSLKTERQQVKLQYEKHLRLDHAAAVQYSNRQLDSVTRAIVKRYDDSHRH